MTSTHYLIGNYFRIGRKSELYRREISDDLFELVCMDDDYNCIFRKEKSKEIIKENLMKMVSSAWYNPSTKHKRMIRQYKERS